MAIATYRPGTDPIASLLAGLTGIPEMNGSIMRASADVIETEDEIRVLLEMPGMDPDDIEVELESNVLTISGEKKEERSEGDEESSYHLSERRYGRITRSFVLPREVEHKKIKAQFDNGVLNVRIPKPEKSRRRRIQIRSGGGKNQRIEAKSK